MHRNSSLKPAISPPPHSTAIKQSLLRAELQQTEQWHFSQILFTLNEVVNRQSESVQCTAYKSSSHQNNFFSLFAIPSRSPSDFRTNKQLYKKKTNQQQHVFLNVRIDFAICNGKSFLWKSLVLSYCLWNLCRHSHKRFLIGIESYRLKSIQHSDIIDSMLRWSSMQTSIRHFKEIITDLILINGDQR